MVKRLIKASSLGLCAGLLGAVVVLIPVTFTVEESVGLKWLYHLRGYRPPPSDVIIVTIDKVSADRLGLPNVPVKWPRSLHAKLVSKLSDADASVIAFDIHFKEPRNKVDDLAFASAIKKAGNVVLFEYLKKEIIPVRDKTGRVSEEMVSERLIPPIPELKDAASVLAPFPLPKVPVMVNQFWLFKMEAGDAPTLPVVALQIHGTDVYKDLVRLIHNEGQKFGVQVPMDMTGMRIKDLVRNLRSMFIQNPNLGDTLLQQLLNNQHSGSRKDKLLESLVNLYQGPGSHYLNYYGPPRSIRTVPYYQVLNMGDSDDAELNKSDFEGKAVFVGFSEKLQPEQRDGFYSVFSEDTGVDISGVEIAATAFANLLENMPVRPIPRPWNAALLLLWGLFLGVSLRLLSVPIALAGSAIFCIGYLFVAYSQFQQSAIWLPVFIPLVIQAPIALLAAIIWHYVDVNRERQRIRIAFGHYLPDHVVDKVSSDLTTPSQAGELANGICLATDAAQYTTLSEELDPRELSKLMNEYYAVLFAPVKQHNGIISDVEGDAMLAVWAAPTPDSGLRTQACKAALEIAVAARDFRASTLNKKLPTRIGLHAGEIFLGNIGAGDHFEYRPVGDIVNTANRIQDLNKYLNTNLLVSAETLEGTLEFVSRDLGSFLLAGKSRPLVIHELICSTGEASPDTRQLCSLFNAGLDAYRHQSWAEALQTFVELLDKFGDDGPARFYLDRCRRFLKEAPPTPWDATVQINK